MTPTNAPPRFSHPLHGRDYVLLAAFALMLFGYTLFSGKPLTMHEARLPQLSREMLATGRWLLPHSGERPWLERPPLPHWITLVIGHLMGRLNEVWIVRIPPVLMGTLTVMLVAWTASRLFGRAIGLLSALLLATMYEFYFYSTVAEDDIFLAALVAVCVALFTRTEFPERAPVMDHEFRFLGNRPWTVWAFFGVLGLTSLAKGPLIGATEVTAATGVFLFLCRDRARILRYTWLWGWLLFVGTTVSWPVIAYNAYPSVLDNWKYDYVGPFGREPFWYYVVTLLWTAAPWTPAAFVGLWVTWKKTQCSEINSNTPLSCMPWSGASPTYWFLWCWAIVPLIVLSIPARKHHHYLVPVLAGWAVLAAFGIRWMGQRLFSSSAKPSKVMWGLLLVGLSGLLAIGMGAAYQKIPGPLWLTAALGLVWVACVSGISVGLFRQSGRLTLGVFLGGVMILSFWGQSILGTARSHSLDDVTFLRNVGRLVPADKPLIIVAQGSMHFFRNQFYSRPEAILAHNITYLRDDRIRATEVYLIARYRARTFIGKELGMYEIVTQSAQSRREGSPDDRWTLFRLRFNPNLIRYSCPKISVLQAMERGEGGLAGPYCDPPPARS